VTARVALVTGANRGIGLEVARALGVLGHRVIVTARQRAELDRTVALLRGERLDVAGCVLDVTDAASVAAAARAVTAEHGAVDILVNNAGVALDKFVSGLAVDLDTVRRTYDTNVFGLLSCIQAFAPAMKARNWGRIVNVSSELGSLTAPRNGTTLAYRSAKAAVNAITVYLAAELADAGVLVNAAAPGWCRTELGGEGATRSAAEGADTIVWLATLPDGGPTGGFFRDRAPHPW
jgi:NAD(P)-dependent dehydrogenase (short-subunit alcohol dehydrogenase family)